MLCLLVMITAHASAFHISTVERGNDKRGGGSEELVVEIDAKPNPALTQVANQPYDLQ